MKHLVDRKMTPEPKLILALSGQKMKHLVDRKITPKCKLILAQLAGSAIKYSTSGNLVKCSTIGKGPHWRYGDSGI